MAIIAPNVEKAVKQLLVAAKKHEELVSPLDSEPLGIVSGDIMDTIWTLYDYKLKPGECSDGFMESIHDYLVGRLELDECLDELLHFVTASDS